MSQIMDLRGLVIGQKYRVVTNLGYFNHVCTLTNIHIGGSYCFRDTNGREHYVHQHNLWQDDNPIRIYYV